MKIVTTEQLDGNKLEMIGIVRGSTVQTRNIGRDILGGLKTIVGGEIRAYSEMLDNARDIATERMIQDAEKLGADAVVNLRYATSAVMQGAAEVMAYGTAVKFI
ncbi:MAG: YbjQ family protein [Spirochaetaceae bacterium]|nr:YbjQ family protein [Spirochaetaceae bacterium]